MLQDIGAFAAQVLLSAGGAAALIVAVVKAFGTGWLSHHFAKDLEAFKSQQQGELERVREAIAVGLDRSTRLHQGEFTAVPEVWTRLSKAHYAILVMVHPFQSSPDLSRMQPGELEDFLERNSLSAWRKHQVQIAVNPTERYREFRDEIRFMESLVMLTEASESLLRNGIFMDLELYKKMDDHWVKLNSALREYQVAEGSRRNEYPKAARDALIEGGHEPIDALRVDVRHYLETKRVRLVNSAAPDT